MYVQANHNMPYLTERLPGVGGKIKVFWNDFFVEEIPLYEPCGRGNHLFIHVEKKGRATLDATVQIARALHISPQQVGYAGLKDTWAVTRQWLSLEHINAEQVEHLDIPRIKILRTARHENKLRIGHLAGNRFTIRIREPAVPLDQAVSRTEDIVNQLTISGVGNFFGPQRFGKRNDTHKLGEAIVRDDPQEFMDLFLGRPQQKDKTAIYEARSCYDQGEYKRAYESWPFHFHDHHRALRALIRGKTKQQALSAVDKHHIRLYISAFQSDLFNRVLAARMPDIDKLLSGDMAYKHDNGACFRVEDAQLEQPRCTNFEISPTGPLFGYLMAEAEGKTGEIEKAVLSDTNLELADFRLKNSNKVKGGRRPLRFQPRNVNIGSGTDENGPYLELRFELNSGCYATVLLREITKYV
ncbi:MAG: tRNA pseudouridine(13) synthase TruD [Sedimentisphaerales bacterium]|nr:tRNA pseudouridine(13) synthase TruD [Sedimentisphaerales bacterium]